jgi:hypothetical protein
MSIKRIPLLSVLFLSSLLLLCLMPEKDFISSLDDFSYSLHRQLFGFSCPGCGLTRATYYLIHLNFTKSLNLNPTVIFIPAIFFGEAFNIFRKDNLARKLRYIIYALFCSSLLLLYLTRILNHQL